MWRFNKITFFDLFTLGETTLFTSTDIERYLSHYIGMIIFIVFLPIFFYSNLFDNITVNSVTLSAHHLKTGSKLVLCVFNGIYGFIL